PSLPVSFVPCWVHVEPERVNAHAAPAPLLSPGPPISAVKALPSAASATLEPNLPGNLPAPGSSLTSPVPVSFVPCWVAVVSERHADAEFAREFCFGFFAWAFFADLFCARELFLLGPFRFRVAREHPHRARAFFGAHADALAFTRAADQGGVAVGGQRRA